MLADPAPLHSLFIQEKDTAYRLDGAASNYLAGERGTTSKSKTKKGIYDDWRFKIAEWSFDVVDHFSFDREVVAIALNYVDRFVLVQSTTTNSSITTNRHNSGNDEEQHQHQIGKKEYQLLTLTSLYLAIKLHGELSNSDDRHGGMRPSLQVFVHLSRDGFTAADIEHMERKLLNSLQWRVNPPMPVSFIKCLLSFLPSWRSSEQHRVKFAIYEMARYLAEISVCNATFSTLFQPSVLAYASILASVDALSRDASLSSFPPIRVIDKFIYRISSVTSLDPTMDHVQKARSMLSENCPTLSDANTWSLTVSAVEHRQQQHQDANYNNNSSSSSPVEVYDTTARTNNQTIYDDDNRRSCSASIHYQQQQQQKGAAPSPTEAFAFHEQQHDEYAY